MESKGIFVVSLDFELYWGMFDKVTLDEYGKNIAGVHEVIPELLSLFRENNIHATWATVGMLMADNAEDLAHYLPEKELQPSYADMNVSSYKHISEMKHDRDQLNHPYYFGENLVQQIIETPHQELGSHTFSHYYTLDGIQNSAAIFDADCHAFQKVSARFNQTITSIVFPRNQTTLEALTTCVRHGLTVYRGTPSHFLYTGKTEKEQTHIFLRILRIIDAYINISGHHTVTLSKTKEDQYINVPGSRFLRPYSKKLRWFEKLRLQRIKDGMTHAAKHNEIFHLWWHPHNFGINRKENLSNLLEIIRHYTYLHKKYGMRSASMQDVAISANE